MDYAFLLAALILLSASCPLSSIPGQPRLRRPTNIVISLSAAHPFLFSHSFLLIKVSANISALRGLRYSLAHPHQPSRPQLLEERRLEAAARGA